MTDKERLERIIQMQYDGYTIWDMSEDDLVWLIEQAEQVYELEGKIERYREAIKKCLERMNAGGTGTRSFVYETLKKALEVEGEMNEICPTCSGSGGIELFEYSIGEVVTIPCPDCGGSEETTDVERKVLEGEE